MVNRVIFSYFLVELLNIVRPAVGVKAISWYCGEEEAYEYFYEAEHWLIGNSPFIKFSSFLNPAIVTNKMVTDSIQTLVD